MTTETIKLMRSHRSIRQYTDKAITPADLEQIILAAQAAATSSHLQCVSIIHVTDTQKRERMVELTGGQGYVASASDFFIFCADYRRFQEMFEEPKVGFTEQIILSSVDAGLMGQNAMLAAQSLGLGAVFIGGVRNHPTDVVELLDLPEQVFPLFGLCLGYPEQSPELKPRMPISMMLHENSYQSLDKAELAAYDQEVSDYYGARSSNNKCTTWTQAMEEKVFNEARPFMLDCLNKQGFNQR